MDAKIVMELIEALSNEKRLPMDTVFSAVEQALAEATRRHYEDKRDDIRGIRVDINRESGIYSTHHVWKVVHDDIARPVEIEETELEHQTDFRDRVDFRDRGYGDSFALNDIDAVPEVYNCNLHLLLKEAQEKDANLKVDDIYSEPIDNIVMDRITIQQARQVIFKQLRHAERAQILSEYSDQVGVLLNGTIDRTARDGYIVLLRDRVESFLPYKELIGEERFRPGETVRAILQDIDIETRGMRPQLTLSRSTDTMLLELFKLEVPEVSERIIEILGVARESGSRSKIAVKTNDGRIDPVGVCVGMRGARVAAVTNQLNGERIDIILWDDNPRQLVSNALSPAKVESVLYYDGKKLLEVVVAQENLASAVGTRGENVRLASKLIDMEIKVISVEEAKERKEEMDVQIATRLSEELEVPESATTSLVRDGFGSLEHIFASNVATLERIPGLDAELAEKITNKAGELLMIRAMDDDQDQKDNLDKKLLALAGMNIDMALHLNKNGIKTVENLAEKSVDEMRSIVDIGEKDAEALIMEARKPWLEGSTT